MNATEFIQNVECPTEESNFQVMVLTNSVTELMKERSSLITEMSNIKQELSKIKNQYDQMLFDREKLLEQNNIYKKERIEIIGRLNEFNSVNAACYELDTKNFELSEEIEKLKKEKKRIGEEKEDINDRYAKMEMKYNKLKRLHVEIQKSTETKTSLPKISDLVSVISNFINSNKRNYNSLSLLQSKINPIINEINTLYIHHSCSIEYCNSFSFYINKPNDISILKEENQNLRNENSIKIKQCEELNTKYLSLIEHINSEKLNDTITEQLLTISKIQKELISYHKLQEQWVLKEKEYIKTIKLFQYNIDPIPFLQSNSSIDDSTSIELQNISLESAERHSLELEEKFKRLAVDISDEK